MCLVEYTNASALAMTSAIDLSVVEIIQLGGLVNLDVNPWGLAIILYISFASVFAMYLH